MRDTHYTFRGIRLPYLNHPYNNAARNMRSVEIPIAMRYIKTTRKAKLRSRILEVGNALEHYTRRRWQVVDLKEKGRHIHNMDVMRFYPSMRFDLIVSVSTLEHIGHGQYKNSVASPTTPRDVFGKLRGILAEKGVVLATVPLGYNPTLDKQIEDDETGADYAWFMRRLNDDNEWEQCDKATALKMPFDGRWRWGSACAILQVGEFDWTDYGFDWDDMANENVLNLGAGNDIRPNAINHDVVRHRKEIDVAHDLNVVPWPWDNEQFDLIISRAVFEHLDIDLLASMNECWRILRPGGKIYVKLPYWKSDKCYTDPTHRRGYTTGTFNYFDPMTPDGAKYGFYSGCNWKLSSPKYPMFNSAKTSVMATLTKINKAEAKERLATGRRKRRAEAKAKNGQGR